MPGGPEAWELVVMLLVLKLPMVWVGAVVWRAIRADPPGPPTGGDGPGGSRLLPRPPDERSP